MCSESDYASLVLLRQHGDWVRAELEMWHADYLPAGKTILDVGAGCGETAYFYLKHGAERIIGIEADPKAVEAFRQNFPEAVIVPSSAKLVLVEAVLDHIKIDIEGGEKGLVIETHQFNPKLKLHRAFGSNVNLWRLQPARIPPLGFAIARSWAKRLIVWQGRKRREWFGF